MIRVFIGYDARETIAAHVLHHSIQSRASMPVSVTLINRSMLAGVFTRKRDPLDSTDFAISRFLVPYLCHYEGYALFVDCDILCRDDIARLWAWRDDRYAVRVVKHDYTPKTERKFLGAAQTKYARKNWSSVMLFNNAKCYDLTPKYVNVANGLELHQYSWLADSLIGDLPRHWNHLVGYYPHDSDASLVHFTDGGPYFKGYQTGDYTEEWFHERASTQSVND